MRSYGALPGTAGLRPGDHVCWLYESAAEHRAALTTYLLEGIATRERILYFYDRYRPADVFAYLAAIGVDGDKLVREGDLVLLDARRSYLTGGRFDPGAMVAGFAAAAEEAVASGYSGLRAAGETAWLLAEGIDPATVAAYEAAAERMVAGRRLTALCGYDTSDADASWLRVVAAVHAAHVAAAGRSQVTFCLPATEAGTSLAGEVDATLSEVFARALDALNGIDTIDLSDCRFIDVAGLRVLLHKTRERSAAGDVLRVRGASPLVRRCVALLGRAAAGVSFVD